MSDIKQINGQYYDFTPNKNESFLITAKELKTLGIKNFYFMLKINNPRVADIDPFKKNITRQEIDALLREYRGNIWYFARTAVRLRTDKGIVPFELHRGLAALIWNFNRHQDCCICEPRQTWKTSGTIAVPIQWTFQLSENARIHFFGKETENTKRNLSSLKDDIDLLPEWLQFKKFLGDDGKIKKSRQSAEILENKLLKNSVKIHPKASSLSHAQGIARGDSGSVIYYDEIEHTPYFGEILSNSAPLFKTAADNAKKAGLPHCRIMSCTPGNLDTREGRESYPIIQSMIPWSEKIYDMTESQISDYKSAYKEDYHSDKNKRQDREVIDVFYMEYQYYQVRKDYDWVMEQYKLSGDKMAVRREILLQRLRGSTESPISPEDIEYLISHMIKSDKDILINGKWRFRLYDHGIGYLYNQPKEFDENVPYLVGIDPASGGGGDNFAVTIINPYNLKVAAEFKSPYIGGPDAVRMLTTLVENYIPKAVLIPEKNSMGVYLIQMLLETPIRDNLYWSESVRQLEEMTEEDPDNDLKLASQALKKYGHWTGKNRKAMFEILFQHVNTSKDLLNTEYVVDDICKLIRTSTGRIEAVKGEHDDSIMSYLIAMYVYYTGDNLQLFGIRRMINPIFGDNKEIEKPDDINVINEEIKIKKPEKITYDEEVINDARRVESELKTICNTLKFVRDPVYSKKNNNKQVNQFDDNVDIGPWFFDSINGI